MKPDNNIDFDKVDSIDDYESRCTIVRWYKDGVVIKELSIPEQICHGPEAVTLCPACLKYRGELVNMYWAKNGRLRCPTCQGYLSWVGERQCECGEIPHDRFCPMGQPSYYLQPDAMSITGAADET